MISNFSYCRRAISTALDRIAVLARGRAKRWASLLARVLAVNSIGVLNVTL